LVVVADAQPHRAANELRSDVRECELCRRCLVLVPLNSRKAGKSVSGEIAAAALMRGSTAAK